jgi:multidrug resistance efflux pump
MVLQKLPANGAMVRAGEPIVEFDRQQQLRVARENETEWLDLDAQLRKKRAELATQVAKDETEVQAAEVTLALAQLDLLKNDMLPRLDAQKNSLNVETAKDTQTKLREWFLLARAANRAALRVLEIRRDRAELFMRQAQSNADRMSIRAPISGLVMLKTTWRAGGVNAVIEEGDGLRPGAAILGLIGPGPMRVRANVNQVDVGRLHVGQMASVRLDSDQDVVYPAHLETISPVAVVVGFSLSSEVRVFTVVFRLDKAGAGLTPDLTAAVDVELGPPPSPTRGRK